MNLLHFDEFINDLLFTFHYNKTKSVSKLFGDKFNFINKIKKPRVYKIILSNPTILENFIKISQGMESIRYAN